ncbi:MAG: DUF86 domain-containing protein [Actinomycetaceae bacterium]|nr:DUF86 domain-containing protein [Actinomycetaceae bacterium]
MSRVVKERIDDILKAIEKSKLYIDLVIGEQNPNLIAMAEDAVERNLQIVGEAVTRLPESLTSSYPQIPWAQIRGFRNILVHEYFGVDLDVVRDVVENHLPPLASVLRKHLSETNE